MKTLNCAMLSLSLSLFAFGQTISVNQFTRGDAGERITQAIAALPSTGGIVDARGFGATTQTISSQLNIGSATKPVTLLVDGRSTRFNVTVTGGIPAIQIFNGSGILCGGTGFVQGGPATQGGFVLGGSANVRNLITNGTQDGTQEFIFIDGCTFQGNQTATVTGPLAYFKRLFVNSYVRNSTFVGLVPNNTTVQLEGVGVFDWDNNWVNGASGVAVPNLSAMKIIGSSGPITITGGAIEHSTGGNAELRMDGSTGFNSGIDAVRGVTITGVYIEGQTGSGNGVEMNDADSVTINGLMCGGNTAGNDCVKITEGDSGRSKNIVLNGIDNLFAVFTNTVNDTASGGRVITAPLYVPHYVHNGTDFATIIDAQTGFRINGTAASDHCLLGNGTNYVDASSCALTGADISTSNQVTQTHVNSEMQTQAPRYLWATFLAGNIGSNTALGSIVPDKAITVTRIDVDWITATANCTVAPTITVSDGTNAITLTVSNATAQQTATFSQNYAANTRLNLSTTAGTCTTFPSQTMIQVQYKMQ